MTKLARLVAASIAALLVGGGAQACARAEEKSDAETSTNYAASKESSAMAQRQSSNSGIYFLGVPLAKARSLGWTKIDEREAAAAKFPTIESCLATDPEKAESLSIDWRKVGSDIESEVCLARVANRLGSPKKMVAWLKSHGFDVIDVRAPDGTNVASEASERAGVVIEASWPIEKNGPLSRRGFVSPLVQRLLAHNASVIIFISEPSEHVSVNVVTNML